MKARSTFTLLLTLGFCVGAADAKNQAKDHKSRDINGDNILSRDEFMADRKHPDKAAKRFDEADANHDGQLDHSERATLRKHHGKKQNG